MAASADSTLTFSPPQDREDGRPERPSRRGLIATLITAPLAGGVTAVALKREQEDPIFVAINAERVARLVRDADESGEHFDEWSAAYEAVFRVKPTTMAGFVDMVALFYDREVNDCEAMSGLSADLLNSIVDAGCSLLGR